MSRMSMFSSPMFLGFDDLERMLDRAAKTSGDGYPPYNIERLSGSDGSGEQLLITLAVAGFSLADLDISLEENQLSIRGTQEDEPDRDYLHRGIAARQFQRTFVLAEGIEVTGADLENGILSISLERVEPEKIIRTITINDHEGH